MTVVIVRRVTPPHITALNKNLEDVGRLLEIHGELVGEGPGQKHNVEVLHKSAVVLLVACWESFVEDLAVAVFDYMLKNAKSHDMFPNKVLTLASAEIKNSKDETKVWGLAGDGWRHILLAHRESCLSKLVGGLNTPRAKQVDELFSDLVGLSGLSKQWRWKKMSSASAVEKLSELITTRGAIAHRVSGGKAITKKYVTDYVGFINRLAAITHNRALAYISSTVRRAPWVRAKYGKTK